MSIYASFITEFGLFCFLAFLLLVLAHVAVHHGWSRRNICWFILLAYLYIQFESYAFYAIPPRCLIESAAPVRLEIPPISGI